MIEEALDYYQSGNFEAAYALYQKMLDDEPRNPQVLYMMALCRQKQSRWPDARGLLQQAISVEPESSLFYYSLGAIEVRLGDLQASLNAYTKASQYNPSEPRAWVGQGYAAMLLGKNDEAKQALRTALRGADDQPEIKATAMTHLGVIAVNESDFQGAQKYLQDAVNLNPDDPYAQAQLGYAFLQSGQAAFAVQCLRNAMELNAQRYSNDAQLNLWLGQALEQTGDLAAAIDAWRKSLNAGMQDPQLMYHLGRAYLQAQQPQQAMNLLSQGHSLAPDMHTISEQLGQAYLDLQRTEDALAVWESVPFSERSVHRKRVRALLGSGQLSSASQLAGQLQADGDDEDYLLAAQVALALQHADEAHHQLNQLGERAQNDGIALWLRACAYALDDPKQAYPLVSELLQHPELPASLKSAVVQLQAKLHHNDQAYELAFKALNALPKQVPAILNIVSENQNPASNNAVDEALFDRGLVRSWPPKAPGRDHKRPVIILGWPGTGRQQLLNALTQIPELAVVRDRPMQRNESAKRHANQVTRRQLLGSPLNVTDLSAVTEAQWLQRRRDYRQQISQASHGRVLEHHQVFVDSVQLPATALLPIQRFFPETIVICLNAAQNDLILNWYWSGFSNTGNMLTSWKKEQKMLDAARYALELTWLDINSSELFNDPGQALRPFLQLTGCSWENKYAEAFQLQLLQPPAACGNHYQPFFS